MSLTIHAGNKEGSLFVTNENAALRHAGEKENKRGRSTVFAGDLAVRPDRITLRRKQAQEQAMKVLSDTFSTDKKMDQGINDMKNRVETLQAENVEYYREIEKIGEMREEQMETSGITEDSQEYKDLELLRKERDSAELTEEETERLNQIHESGVTDYQKNMLEFDEQEKLYQGYIEGNSAEMKGIRSALSDMKLERLKSDPMVEASKQAEEILDAANKEIIGELRNEAKEHIEEKMEEEKEKAEKRAEKKEEEEKRKEKAEEREEREAAIEERRAEQDMYAYNDSDPQPEKELEEILDKMKLLQEDLKGAAVDKNI